MPMNIGNLSLLCWNVCELDDLTKCAVVKEIIHNSNATVFYLQETKLSDISLTKFHSLAPPLFHHYTYNKANRSRGGTITAWKPSITLNQSYNLTYSTMTVLTNNLKFQFMLTNVYGPTDNTYKTEFLRELCIVACMHDLPWILLGDFNILRDIQDTTSQHPNLHSMIEFNQFILDLNVKP
jgi:exonuclease III